MNKAQSSSSNRRRVLTGDRPTGSLHLGHYVASLTTRLALQEQEECFFFIADYHMLTTHFSAIPKLTSAVEELVLDYLSVGIDPNKCVLYLQSQVPEVTELFLILSMLVQVPRLQRIPTLKDTMRKSDLTHPSLGLLAYPVLQAADILLVRAHLVPVGKDQTSHIEIARELARRFNQVYEPLFPIPQPWIGKYPLLIGLDGKAKMSKSLDNAIYLKDSPEAVRKKIFRMYTDPGRIHVTDPGRIEGNPLFSYFDIFDSNREEVEEYKQAYREGKIGDVSLKQRLAEMVNELLDPIRARRVHFEQHRSWIPEILEEGKRTARKEGQATLQSVKALMKFDYPTG